MSPALPRLLQEVGTPADAPVWGVGGFALIRPWLTALMWHLPQGCSHAVETRLCNSTFLIKRSSFLRWVFFPSYFNRKYFFILNPTQVTQVIQAFSP